MKHQILHIGVTGQEGFIGTHLCGMLRVAEHIQPEPFCREWFDAPEKLHSFAARCDAIVHLAGLSRHEDGTHLYQTNLRLAEQLADAARQCPRPPRLYLGSTTHIHKELPYHASKRDAMRLWLAEGLPATALLMPNTFGPYSRPFYNSVVSTFCALAAQDRTPEQISDATLQLIYVTDLCGEIIDILSSQAPLQEIALRHRLELTLPTLWEMLQQMRPWLNRDELPPLRTIAEYQLWTTLSSYRI